MDLFYETVQKSQHPAVMLLHGFTGTHLTFAELLGYFESGRYLLPDLPGHGRSLSLNPDDYSLLATEESLLEIAARETAGEKPLLIGYSMGGRIALRMVIDHPDAFSGLVLISSSPGLETEREREARREKDAAWVQMLREQGISFFTEKWAALSLFESQRKLPLLKQTAVETERLSQNPEGLALSLLGVGTGELPSGWADLTKVKCPVLLLTGEQDLKFKRLAARMKERLPLAEHVEIQGAGHAIQLEKPEELAKAIRRFQNKHF
ncbi:alpha/beta fold family hydrolase [Listeria floridensis FSL S10-1187]|uniref:Putative 2-succinyl-6-hydroxy-2,4-cyclohexadiene-1-carboxylate synthase n=1 Tax=Listeria floridensis FSL S10-1187 TaxID=1265817 RepID=A0ABN0RHZ3_9LIST|nr:2-succinyl-6-hydroxy-2,4-cyclohexadiene-1-carboxylate synthase [Listeria floridensis]EUJ33579.1 alpha/beta fold family hydrolase [Listeria floridensis FSL S10-1187]